MPVSPTLLVLAAGMGSRYGGLKQMDPMGPNGELLIEYSIYDAIRAGFGKVVFVVRPEIEADFRDLIGSRFAGRIPVAYVNQQLSDLPAGFALPAGRQKPWGTGHAILAAADAIDTPFCVINGDDYYGPAAYRAIADFFAAPGNDAADRYAMVAYLLRNTLTEHGTVARGVCQVPPEGKLREVVERTAIAKDGDDAAYEDADGTSHKLAGETPVSLNFWGFQPSIFSHLRRQFAAFLQARIDEPKAEFFIPTVVDRLIRQGQATVDVLTSDDTWFGVTYAQDKARVSASLRAVTDRGVYPPALWT